VQTDDATAIKRVIAEHRVELALLGMRTPSASSRLVDGCTAEEVYRSGVCPCIVIGPALDVLPLHRPVPGPVIFATNLQEPRLATIRLAWELASSLGAKFECAHVLPEDLEATGRRIQIIPQIMRKALIEGARQHGIALGPGDCHILYGSSVSIALANFIKPRRASMLALAVSRRARYVTHLPPGITARVTAAARCAVATWATEYPPSPSSRSATTR